jgi:hypothetical protein
MWKIYKIYISYYCFKNEKAIQQKVIDYYNKFYFNKKDVKHFFDFFTIHTNEIFTDLFVKKLISLMFANKDFELSEVILKNFGIKNNTMNSNLFCQISEKNALFSTNYMAWLFFILIEDKYSLCWFKSPSNFAKSTLIDYYKIKNLIENTIFYLFLKDIKNQELILKYVNPAQVKLVDRLFLDLSLFNNKSTTNIQLLKI